MRVYVNVLLMSACVHIVTSSPFWGSCKSSCAPCGDVDPAPCCDTCLAPPAPPPQCHTPCPAHVHAPCPAHVHAHPRPCPHKHRVPCPPVVTKVSAPGRIVIKEAPHVVAEYCEGAPTVLHQEAPPRWVFGDTTPIRLCHTARPATIEHFETPYIIDAHQKTNFVNHAAKPVVLDHYQAPTVTRDEGLPPLIQPCECDCPAPCDCDACAPSKFNLLSDSCSPCH